MCLCEMLNCSVWQRMPMKMLDIRRGSQYHLDDVVLVVFPLSHSLYRSLSQFCRRASLQHSWCRTEIVHAQTKGSKIWMCCVRVCWIEMHATFASQETVIKEHHLTVNYCSMLNIHHVPSTARFDCVSLALWHAVTYRRCLLIKHIHLSECLFFILHSSFCSVYHSAKSTEQRVKRTFFNFALPLRTC